MQNDIPPGTKVKKKTYHLDVMIDSEQTEPSYSIFFMMSDFLNLGVSMYFLFQKLILWENDRNSFSAMKYVKNVLQPAELSRK